MTNLDRQSAKTFLIPFSTRYLAYMMRVLWISCVLYCFLFYLLGICPGDSE